MLRRRGNRLARKAKRLWAKADALAARLRRRAVPDPMQQIHDEVAVIPHEGIIR